MPPRTVYITGGSSGIGRAMALEYARAGARVVLGARRTVELEDVVREIRSAGGVAHALTVNVADPTAAAEAVRRAYELLGSLDMVIANAGVGALGHASTMTWEGVERILAVNVTGAFSTLVAAIPIMLAQGGGHLVGVSSLAGRRGVPASGSYSASKAALSAFLDTLRLDLRSSNIRVTDVQPGFVDTPILLKDKNPMPFKWPVDKAARVVVRRLERAPAQIAFPWILDWATYFSRILPAPIYDWIVRRASKG